MGLFGKKKSVEHDAESWFKKASKGNFGGNEPVMIRYYDEAIKIEPNYTKAWAGKGYALYRLKKYEEAISCFDKAITLNPNDASVWEHKGLALHELRKYEEAISCFDEIIRITPIFNSLINRNAEVHKRFSQTKLFNSQKKFIDRKGWTESEKEQVRINQDGQCAICQKPPPRWEYDHIDGNRNNAGVSNCQGLCPNCHSVKTHDE